MIWNSLSPGGGARTPEPVAGEVGGQLFAFAQPCNEIVIAAISDATRYHQRNGEVDILYLRISSTSFRVGASPDAGRGRGLRFTTSKDYS